MILLTPLIWIFCKENNYIFIIIYCLLDFIFNTIPFQIVIPNLIFSKYNAENQINFYQYFSIFCFTIVILFISNMFIIGLNKCKGKLSLALILTIIIIILTLIIQILFPYFFIAFSNYEKQKYIKNDVPVINNQDYYIDVTDTKLNTTIHELCSLFGVNLDHILVQGIEYNDYEFLNRYRDFIDIFGLFKPIYILPNYIIENLDINDTTAFLAQRMYSTMQAREQYINLVLTIFVILCFYVAFRFVEIKKIDDFGIQSVGENDALPPALQILSTYLIFLFMFSLYKPFFYSGKKSVVFINDCKTSQMGFDIETALINYVNLFGTKFESSSLYSNYNYDIPLLSDRIQSLKNCVVLH